MTTSTNEIYGYLAEFDSPDDLLEAAERAKNMGYKIMDGYSPFPVHGLDKALGFKKTKLPALVLLGGLFGAVVGYGLQYFTTVIAYPINVGGRPLHSWPAFIPVTFECTILFAGLAAVFGMLGLNGFPQPYHPVFNAEKFGMASQDKFFLCIESKDPLFDTKKTKSFLEGLKSKSVVEVAP